MRVEVAEEEAVSSVSLHAVSLKRRKIKIKIKKDLCIKRAKMGDSSSIFKKSLWIMITITIGIMAVE